MRTEEEKGRKREEECGDERLGKVGPLFHEGEGDHPRVGGLRAAGFGRRKRDREVKVRLG